MNQLISVIVPIYNTQKYLPRCIESMLNQTYRELEIILVDDGSMDHSREICELYARNDKRIKTIYQENGGASSARNTGLRIAQGEYITFLDSDDYIESSMYQRLFALIKNTRTDIAICGTKRETEKGDFLVQNHILEEAVLCREEAIEQMLCCRRYSYSVCDKLFCRRVIENLWFDQTISHNEDMLFLYYALKRSEKIVYTSEPYYNYCMNYGSATRVSFSHKRMTSIDAQEWVLTDIEACYPELASIAKREIVKVSLYTSIHMVRGGYDDMADRIRVRVNIKKYLPILLKSNLALGYKMLGILISLNFGLFDAYVRNFVKKE